MMGDDGAGPYLYQLLTENPLSDWEVIDGGSAPENVAHQIRQLRPKRLLIVDAADMELPPGKIRIIDKDAIAELFFVSTHNIDFIGIDLKIEIPNRILQPIANSFVKRPLTRKVGGLFDGGCRPQVYDFIEERQCRQKIPQLPLSKLMCRPVRQK